jgi:N-methylhydantoinase A
MTYRISVDTGGTFTDIVVSDEQGRLELGTAPPTRARAYEGLREGIGQVAERLGL